MRMNIAPFAALTLLCISTSAYAIEPSIESLMLLSDKVQAEVEPPTKQAVADTILAKPLRVLIDVRSNHSDGAHDFKTLIHLAEQRHLDALSLNEHDHFTIRLGLEPIPWLIHYSQAHPSLYESGLSAFFEDLKQARASTALTIMAGTESTPGYDWQGLPFKDLSLNNAERHIITLGVHKSEQIKALPSYQLTHAYGLKSLSLVFWFTFVFLLIFVLLRKRKRGVALLLAGSLIAFMSAWLMQKDNNADQDFMRTASEQGLFTIWAHPGTLSGVRDGPMGVLLNTPPYNAYIFDEPADAFAAVYGDTDQNTVAGGLWDRYMMNYMRGYVAKPMWATAAGDYHEEGGANEFLGNFPMDVWATSKKEEDILDALRHGHMAAWHMNKAQNLSLSTLSLAYTDPLSHEQKHMLAGDEAHISPDITLTVGLEERGKPSSLQSLHGQWIIDGKVYQKVKLNIHDHTVQTSTLNLPKGKHVIRFQIPSQQGVRLETNPFLVDVRHESIRR